MPQEVVKEKACMRRGSPEHGTFVSPQQKLIEMMKYIENLENDNKKLRAENSFMEE